MAFLEAMAMRKCVLAHRDATMDEYIRPGENGLLFDAANPARQSIAEVVAIHQHLPDPTAYYRRWLEDAQRIAPFIRETPPVRLSTAQRMADLFLYLLFLGETTDFQSSRLAVGGFLAGVACFLLALVCFLTETLLATRLLDFHMLQQEVEGKQP